MKIDKKTFGYLFLAGVGFIVVYWLLHETERFASVWSAASKMLMPFVIGAGLAFILNVPMRQIENKLKFISREGLRRVVAILLTFVFMILLIVGVVNLLLPQISETVQSLVPKVVAFFQKLQDMFLEFLRENPDVQNWIYTTFNTNLDLAAFDWAGLVQKALNMVSNSVSVIATGAFSAVGSIVGGLVDAIIGIVFALYCLARKEILARQGRKLIYAILPERFCDEAVRILRLTNSTFCNFISGQCLEAVILGCLFAVAMAIFKMPYITLISVLIAVTALVPLVGAFVGCFLGAFFILVNDPLQAVFFVVMFLVIQQIEGNLIYPKVVGDSIGLPGMWVLVALSIGGDLMGFVGMFVMIPVAAVLYTLLGEFASRQVAKRGIDPEKLKNQPPELKSRFREKRERKREQRLLKQMQALAHLHDADKKNEK